VTTNRQLQKGVSCCVDTIDQELQKFQELQELQTIRLERHLLNTEVLCLQRTPVTPIHLIFSEKEKNFARMLYIPKKSITFASASGLDRI